MLQSFDENEEVYKASQKLTHKKPVSGSEQVLKSDNVDSRFVRLSFMKRLLIGAPQLVGYRRAWDMYQDVREGKASYIEKLYGTTFVAPELGNLDEFKQVHRAAVAIIRREEQKAKAPKRRKAAAENEGYSEPVIEPELDHWRFKKENRIRSMVEDRWKADHYVGLCHQIKETLRPDESEIDSDSFKAVLRKATEKYLRNEARPILTNELSDYYNPYMMKRSVTERLLHEGCVRNKLEETLVPKFLNEDPQLVKLRSSAELPPEVVEPIQAFRGVVNWSFDPELRMSQKLESVEDLLNSIVSGSEFSPSMKKASTGFRSTVPRGRRGGWGVGKPLSKDKEYLAGSRYPTLQRVAHSLPTDPQYRSQAMHAIQVLERSRGWEFADKTKAVNAMKEVLDNLPSSRLIAGKLERALPVIRYGRFAPGKLSSSHKFVRRKPRNLLRRNRIRMYFRSMTAMTPLAKRWADRRTKNAARNKKKDNTK